MEVLKQNFWLVFLEKKRREAERAGRGRLPLSRQKMSQTREAVSSWRWDACEGMS